MPPPLQVTGVRGRELVQHKTHSTFDDEEEVARVVVTLARPLRGEDAHGGRPGIRWLRLSFLTERGRWGEPRRSARQRCQLAPASALAPLHCHKMRRRTFQFYIDLVLLLVLHAACCRLLRRRHTLLHNLSRNLLQNIRHIKDLETQCCALKRRPHNRPQGVVRNCLDGVKDACSQKQVSLLRKTFAKPCYVCPEPVLANGRLCGLTGAKRTCLHPPVSAKDRATVQRAPVIAKSSFAISRL